MGNGRLTSRLAATLLAAGLVAAALWFARGRGDRPAADRNRPVALYARVVDDAGRPLPGAVADLWVGTFGPDQPVITGRRADRLIRLTRTAGADGAFAVEGYRGYVLNLVRVARPGHLLSPWTKRGHLYLDAPGAHRPDPAAPVVIRQWRRRGDPSRAPAHVRASWPLQLDGPPVAVDLVRGAVVPAGQPGGDIRVRAVKHGGQELPGGQGWADDWSAVVEAINGGVAEPRPDDEFMFEAPAGGYQAWAAVRVRPGASGPHQLAVFVRGRGGRLVAAANLELARRSGRADHRPEVHMEAHVNTDGSPNLEFDYWHPTDADTPTPEALTLRFRGPPRPRPAADATAAGPASSPLPAP